MDTNKPILPPRKWYSLQQAADKLSKDSGEYVTKQDILHYASQGYLELAIYIDFYKTEFDDYKFNIKGMDMNSMINKLFIIEFRGFSWNSFRENYHFEQSRLTIKDKFKHIFSGSWNDDYENEDYEYDDYEDEDYEYDDYEDSTPSFYNSLPFGPKERMKKAIVNDKELFIITNIEEAKGFFVIDFLDFEHLMLDEDNLQINCNDIILRFSRTIENTNGLNIVINGVGKKFDRQLFINEQSIFILYDDLVLFTQKNQKIRSLSTIESYLDEFKDPTREGQLALKTKKTDQIIEKEQKIIEQTQEESKKYYERIILKSCMETAKKYPDAGVYSIVNAVIQKIKTDYGVTDRKMFYSERHYVNKLRENGKSPHPQRGKNGKTIEPIIKIS
ncbi:hypothetical protein EUX52_04770 [Haemophilus haemolyticus]|uniref:Uncharacterized protein n=1 Tax=Haemophilus haemolyticus TaxID=726 RepID=A0A502LGV3_HAEHA|nr:hypothetical protein [Haemophilus haemolyticus]TPH21501.1 hypothetical protein EUX52_04770 [Haemophilus haemolyticus]